jgi:hypothetical protein
MADKKTNVPATTAAPNAPTIVDFTGLGELSEFKAGKGEQIEGLEGLDRSDYKLPKIKLIQANSIEAQKSKCPAGWFLNTVTGETYENLKCHLLVLGKSRVKWKKPFKRGEEPDCRSFDAIIKFDSSKSCKSCPDADWSKIPAGENKPACNMSYVWLGVTADEHQQIFRLIAPGMSVGPTKDFINTIVPKKYPAFVYNVELSSEQQENEQGVFYVLKYDIKGVITKDEFKPLEELASGMRDMFMETIKSDVTNAVAGEEDEAMAGGEASGEKKAGGLW